LHEQIAADVVRRKDADKPTVVHHDGAGVRAVDDLLVNADHFLPGRDHRSMRIHDLPDGHSRAVGVHRFHQRRPGHDAQ
jgi:hypothetical protein